MRGDLRFTSLAAIDGRIEDLQEQQETTSMSLPEEKALMKEISALRAQRGVRVCPRLVALRQFILAAALHCSAPHAVASFADGEQV